MFWVRKSLVNEYIKIMRRTRILNYIFGYAAYKWIQYNVGIADPNALSKTQIGKALAEYRRDDDIRGFDWKFDNYKNPKFIIIEYSTIKNEYGDIDEDNTATLTFDDFEKWI